MYVDIENVIIQAIRGEFALWRHEVSKEFDAQMKACMHAKFFKKMTICLWNVNLSMTH